MYKVTLTKPEREQLNAIMKKGSHTSHQYRCACILLSVDQGKYADEPCTNKEICKVLKIAPRTIDRVKKEFVEEGLESVLERKPPNREYERKVDGDLEAKLIAMSCHKAPEGFARWSLRLLADQAVELGFVDSISHETVRRVLKKTT